MVFAPLKSSASLVDQVCSRLARQLRREVSAGNDRLPAEREMARQLGVSRTVLREATKRLEIQGMLEIRHGSGIKIVDKLHKPFNGAFNLLVPDERERLAQLLEVRLALEPENARFAAERATATQRRRLKSCQERLASSVNFEEQVQADMEFHNLLAEASGNRIAATLVQSLSELLQASLKHGYSRVTKERAVHDHATVLDAVLKGDGAAAAKAMKQHLLHARLDLGLNTLRRARR